MRLPRGIARLGEFTDTYAVDTVTDDAEPVQQFRRGHALDERDAVRFG